MLRERLRTALAAILIAICIWIVLALIAQFFGMTMEVCDGANCPRYNLIIALLWNFLKIFNDGSPLITAIATGFIGYFTWTLWQSNEAAGQLAERSAKHLRVVERAYIKMSHEPPGVNWITPNHDMFEVMIRIKNHGKTPANVTDVLLKHSIVPHGGVLPDIPDYSLDRTDEPAVSAFLVADDKFYWRKNFILSATQAARIDGVLDDLVIYGVVEYTDKFGGKHQARYARIYLQDDWLDPFPGSAREGKPRNNLNMVTQAGYNDDIGLPD